MQAKLGQVLLILNLFCRKASGYTIQKDHEIDVAAEETDKIDANDFEDSIISGNFLSDDSETDLVSWCSVLHTQ